MENRRRILVAQSDTRSAFELRSKLLQNGWDVLVANDALQAFSLAIREKPAAVIVSAELAGGGGLSLVKRMKNSVHTGRIPAVAILASGDRLKQEFQSAGIADVLEGPISSQSLNQILQRHTAVYLEVKETPLSNTESVKESNGEHDRRIGEAPGVGFFNDLTALTTKLVKAPAALLSLVDREGQFFSSEAGSAGTWADPRRNSLFHSFCQWVACSRDESVVADARGKNGLLASLGLRDLGIVAYAGVPVSLRGGVVGSLCAVDAHAHPWTNHDTEQLRDLSKIAENYVELKAAQQQVRQAKSPNGQPGRPTTRCIDAAENLAARILDRHGPMDPDDRDLLLRIVHRFSAQIAHSAGKS